MGIIRLKNMQFYGYHGVSDSEKHLGGKFEVDLEMSLDLRKACHSDKLEDTIDYEAIYRSVESCIKEKKYYLVEAVADAIAGEILTHHQIVSMKVRVRKPHAPVRGVLDTVEVELEREKYDYA